MIEFFEIEERLIFVRDRTSDNPRGWAWSSENRHWRAVTPEFALTAWASGKPVTSEQAQDGFYVDLQQLPGESV